VQILSESQMKEPIEDREIEENANMNTDIDPVSRTNGHAACIGSLKHSPLPWYATDEAQTL
jgi:hypothetical protein